ncbi:hypothetical protein H0H87_012533 [Tephrocybe sp. NHM501043]|nr:hypothetical protein H0H87_012533 [Tephrocybe sp. NHM501043]
MRGVFGRSIYPSMRRGGLSFAYAPGTPRITQSRPSCALPGTGIFTLHRPATGLCPLPFRKGTDVKKLCRSRIKIYSVNRSRAATAERLKDLEKRGIPFEPLTRPLEFGLETTEEYSTAVAKHPREPLS